MQKLAATKIDKALRGNNGDNTIDGETPEESQKEPQTAKFEAVKGKRRKSGTGCISKLGDNLYEGRYSPKGADGKRISRNVYAKTEEECERLLAEMIVEMKAEIKTEKERLKAQRSA